MKRELLINKKYAAYRFVRYSDAKAVAGCNA